MGSVYSRVVVDVAQVGKALRVVPRYYVVEEQSLLYDAPIFRFMESGLEDPGVVPVPLWAGMAFIHDGHPVRVVYFEWEGALWGGVSMLDVKQSVIRNSMGERVDEFLVSCCERVSSLESGDHGD